MKDEFDVSEDTKSYALQVTQGLKTRADDTISNTVNQIVFRMMYDCFMEGYRRALIEYDLIETPEAEQEGT